MSWATQSLPGSRLCSWASFSLAGCCSVGGMRRRQGLLLKVPRQMVWRVTSHCISNTGCSRWQHRDQRSWRRNRRIRRSDIRPITCKSTVTQPDKPETWNLTRSNRHGTYSEISSSVIRGMDGGSRASEKLPDTRARVGSRPARWPLRSGQADLVGRRANQSPNYWVPVSI